MQGECLPARCSVPSPMTMELADEADDEEQVLAMQGELLTRCLLHLHGILHLHFFVAGSVLLTLPGGVRFNAVDTQGGVGVGGISRCDF